MGEIADYYHDQALMAEAQIEEKIVDIKTAYDKGKLVWLTKDEKRILIQDMTTTHIKNSINYIKRNTEKIDDYTETIIDILNQELKKRKIL